MKQTARQIHIGMISCVIVAMLATVSGCRHSPTTAGPTITGQGSQATADELSARPMYTFNEAEVDRYLRIAREVEPDLGKRVIHLGRKNIGQPYDIYLLGEFPYEWHDPDPIYCLDKSDCLTFSEHMFAMALSRDWWGFLRVLQRIRYAEGEIGMVTRNHYTIAEWNRNNAFLFEDMTERLGGGELCVPLHQVCRRAKFFAKFGIGQDIPDEVISDRYIPKASLPEIAGELREGDFVNIIRGGDDSQWCGHTGLIAIGPDGAVNFLHSARPHVREQSLVEYVNGDRRCLGIKILRMRPEAEAIMNAELASSPLSEQISEGALSAAVADSPLASEYAPLPYGDNWIQAMELQSYRLPHDVVLDAGLQAELEALESQVAEELGIPFEQRAFGVLDLTDLRVAMIRPDEMFYGASVPKICIVMAYFLTHPEAVDNLDPDVERELKLVIKRSSNELAAKYSKIVGLDAIQEMLQSREYRFYDKEHGGGFWCGKHYGFAEPRMGDPVHDHSHAVTVRQCLRYYLMLEQGRLVNARVCARLKEIFAAPELEFHNKDFVRGLEGRDVRILRKGGLWEDWHLDTARIQHGQRAYILAGMTHHPNGEEYLARMAAEVDALLCGAGNE